jgi:hypothetical protein
MKLNCYENVKATSGAPAKQEPPQGTLAPEYRRLLPMDGIV